MKTRMCEGKTESGTPIMTRRPVARHSRKKDAEGEPLLICPVCGHEDDLQGYDCLGADVDCVFCNGCQTELAL